jgi:hypothetical protein
MNNFFPNLLMQRILFLEEEIMAFLVKKKN